MLNCIIDGERCEVNHQNDEHLTSVIGSLSTAAAQNGRLITSLKINGEEHDFGTITADSILISEVNSLEIVTGTPENLALNLLVDGNAHLGELYSFLFKTSEAYRAGDEEIGRVLFIDLIRGMELFVQTVSTVESLLQIDFSATVCDDKTLAQAVTDLNRVLLEIVTAQQQRDWVLFTDLLEYELATQLETWRDIFVLLQERGVAAGADD